MRQLRLFKIPGELVEPEDVEVGDLVHSIAYSWLFYRVSQKRPTKIYLREMILCRNPFTDSGRQHYCTLVSPERGRQRPKTFIKIAGVWHLKLLPTKGRSKKTWNTYGYIRCPQKFTAEEMRSWQCHFQNTRQ